MSNDPSDDTQAKAIAHVQMVADVTINAKNVTLSNEQIAPIIAAYAQDLQDGADKSVRDEARLAKVEAQTHVLAEAVVAITQTDATLAPAVKAVKDEM